MSTLSPAEKQYLEAVLDMRSGYVLDYSDASFGQFFYDHDVDIHSARYQRHGSSKAKKLRAFWEIEPDSVVGPALSGLLDGYAVQCDLSQREPDSPLLEKCRGIASRLSGVARDPSTVGETGFLSAEFAIPDLQKLPVESTVAEIVRRRLEEAQTCLRSGAYLSVIFLCGSVLEAVLLGAAQNSPKTFNQSDSSPKNRDGNVKPFPEWTLSELINVARDTGVLKPDVQKFSHGLRHFRNYIHPYQQMSSGFSPDEHTAKLCFQALKAALADVSGERK